MSTPTSAIKLSDAGRRDDGPAPHPLPPASASEPGLPIPVSREPSVTPQKSPAASDSQTQGSSFPTFAKKTPTKLSRSTTPNAKELKPVKPAPAAVHSPAAIDPKVGGSFLSRLSMRGGRRRDDDEESVFSDQRTEGNNAHVFSSVIGSGYIPHHKEPPRYIRIKAHNKKNREFNRMFLAQELTIPQPEANDEKGATVTTSNGSRRSDNGGAIWATEFSPDGKYFAAAGKDQVVRVWAVISTHEERRRHEDEESANDANGERLSAPVFRSKPVHEFRGHTGEVLDLSWSKNNFLLSSSMDKTIRLWHISRKECLFAAKSNDFTTSICFHPTDDRFFLAGSLDSTLRLWSIPDKAVAYSAHVSDLITAVAFSPDGKTAIAGVYSGMCMFYDTDGLKNVSQLHVRSSRGKNAKGSKITGIKTMVIDEEVKVLITSNDSRVRLYNLRDKSLDAKFKGLENTCSQIHADFSDNGQWIVSGSEDKKTYIWSVRSADSEKDKPCEYFDAHSDRVSTAIFAPTKSRQLLGGSGDPLYDLCNPPPVTLMSLEESIASQGGQSDDDTKTQVKKPEESPQYIEKSKHFDGQILVTTDQSGVIKVFRQDCAFIKRRHESRLTGSMSERSLSPNKAARTPINTSAANLASEARKQPYAGSPQARPQLPASPTSSRASRERGPSIPPTPSFSFRSADEDDAESDELRLDPAGASYSFWNLNRWRGISSLRSSVSFSNVSAAQSQGQGRHSMSTADTTPTTASNVTKASRRKSIGPGIFDKTVEEEQNGTSIEKDITEKVETDPQLLRPGDSGPNGRINSIVSRLSSEYTSDEGDQMNCQKCGSREFKAKRVGGRQRLICVGCGKLVEDGK
ncbi:putative WD repeat-containing protein [Colletotrichum sp. SAR 10_99]|nr:putative WD repeat-containing protein [Colletotrichum sp. SAR 10_96]KAI8269126.1 putative WD repeat-containing protein [Colletotrichum sp. SAR 10_98]KAJ5012199.1 putative WD repeat-containing protein [Colletotrichum sp. SAR 10_99]